MTVAFYAPLKPISSPNPSGDRLIGRMLKKALEFAGYDVNVVSAFRSYDGKGDLNRQSRIKAIGQKKAQRLVKQLRHQPPEFWFTYHLYRKAPDWIGPVVCRELGIPYVVAEASFAPSQAQGKWTVGHHAVAEALSQVNLAVGTTAADEPCLLPQLGPDTRYRRLKPFIDLAPFKDAAASRQGARAALIAENPISDTVPWLLTIAMMRPGVKFESYQVLADALKRCKHLPWHLLVAGDGPEQEAVRNLFKDIDDRIVWLGHTSTDETMALYAACDVFAWPSVRESPGMVFLEAQASGLPVVGGNGGSVSDVIEHGCGGFLAEIRNAEDFASHIRSLLTNEAQRRKMGQSAIAFVKSNHSLEIAAGVLKDELSELRP